MQDPYPIPVFTTPARASVRVPGSKSITNRALVIAALADGNTLLENCLFSRDTEIMIQALRDLGFEIDANASSKSIQVSGKAGIIPKDRAKIDVGNSGTSARFLTAMLAIREGGEFEVDGDPAMRKRPIAKLVDTLSQLGCSIETTDGFFPIRIRPRGLNGGVAAIDASESSQFVSALLMAAPHAKDKLTLKLSDSSVRRGYIDLTLGMMQRFGIPTENLSRNHDSYTVAAPRRYKHQPNGYFIESDASAASYFFALPFAVGGEIEIQGISKDSIQGDIEFTRIAESSGASIEWSSDSVVARFDSSKSRPQAPQENFYKFSDTFMSAAALAPIFGGETYIEGVAHPRHQECDRIAAMKDGLQKLGQHVHDTDSSIRIIPAPLQPATIETYEDHRIAMSFAILGTFDVFDTGESWLRIIDPLCCRKTFPDFFETLEQAREDSLQACKR